MTFPQKSSQAHRYHFGLIGNCAYSALIDTNANVRWMCWPRFDSSFIFGSLLDEDRGGFFSIGPAGDPKTKSLTSSQRYLGHTNVLCTRFETEDGIFEVTDFAPRFLLFERYHKPLMLFRKVKKISGHPRIRVRCHPKGNYGEIFPSARMGSNHIRYEGLGEPVRLTTNASLTYVLEEKDFVLGEDLYFVLSWGIPLEGPLETTFEEFLNRTLKYWETWVQHCHLPPLFQKQVIRSALVLKLHQYEDTGAIIASCTTSLPEIPQEGRNWDYRLCWLRDTFYTLSALSAIGQFEEMEKYANFIENLNLNEFSVFQPVYRIDGSPHMQELTLPLSGYLGNQPVRIGNGAATQVQNDAYGQVLLALYKLFSDERLLMKRARDPVRLMTNVLNFIEKNMHEPDNGVWEFRGRKLVHTYTLLFHWAGCMAVRKIAGLRNHSSLVERAELCVKKVSALIERCYDPQKKAYVHALGGTDLDASLLQMITLGYLDDSEKAKAHFQAIEKELMIAPGLLLRYRHDDDFGKQQSAFLVCSFWYIEAMAGLGHAHEAQQLLTALVEKTQNHLGLMSEDYDINTESQWGNFPQTYSHVGLINCAFAIDKALKKPPFT